MRYGPYREIGQESMDLDKSLAVGWQSNSLKKELGFAAAEKLE